MHEIAHSELLSPLCGLRAPMSYTRHIDFRNAAKEQPWLTTISLPSSSTNGMPTSKKAFPAPIAAKTKTLYGAIPSETCRNGCTAPRSAEISTRSSTFRPITDTRAKPKYSASCATTTSRDEACTYSSSPAPRAPSHVCCASTKTSRKPLPLATIWDIRPSDMQASTS